MSILSFNNSKSIYAGGLSSMQNVPLKSTQERIQRRQKADSQVEFWEQKKAGLKNMECTTLDEIDRKLEMFHTYEDEIASAKAAYNNEQMFHVLDEAMEQGEKNAEAAERTKPKTSEERREEAAKEALGQDHEQGILSEVLDEVMEEAVKAAEEISEKAEALTEETADRVMENAKEFGQMVENPVVEPAESELTDEAWQYKRFDARI